MRWSLPRIAVPQQHAQAPEVIAPASCPARSPARASAARLRAATPASSAAHRRSFPAGRIASMRRPDRSAITHAAVGAKLDRRDRVARADRRRHDPERTDAAGARDQDTGGAQPRLSGQQRQHRRGRDRRRSEQADGNPRRSKRDAQDRRRFHASIGRVEHAMRSIVRTADDRPRSRRTVRRARLRDEHRFSAPSWPARARSRRRCPD